MRAFLVRWVGNAAALTLLPLWEGSGVHVESFWAALLAILLWGLLNALVKPFLGLFKMLTCLVHALTLGLSTLLVAFALNIALFVALGYGKVLPGFWVDTPWDGVRAALILSLVGFLLNHLVREGAERR